MLGAYVCIAQGPGVIIMSNKSMSALACRTGSMRRPLVPRRAYHNQEDMLP
jgi:hypothetical protein